jgi:hypothetical protein
LKIGKYWRIRRQALEEFLRQRERPRTLVGQLGAFLGTSDNVLAVAQNREFLHWLDGAFFKAGEVSGGMLVKFHDRESEPEGGLREDLGANGLEVGRLEEEGRLRFVCEEEPPGRRVEALERLVGEEAEGGRCIWAAFNWAGRLDLEAALDQQSRITGFINSRRLVVKTALVEEAADDWSLATQRRAQDAHSAAIWFSESGLSLSRLVPLPSE